MYLASDEQERTVATFDIALDTEKLTPKRRFLIVIKNTWL